MKYLPHQPAPIRILVSWVFYVLTFLFVVTATIPEWPEYVGFENIALQEANEAETNGELDAEEDVVEIDSDEYIKRKNDFLTSVSHLTLMRGNRNYFRNDPGRDIPTPPPEKV